MERIDSLSNDKIKFACKIASSSRKRREEKLFFLEGLRLCKDAALSDVEIDYAFFGEVATEKYDSDISFISQKAKKSFVVSKQIEKKLALTENSQGVFCLCRMNSKKHEFSYRKKYIALDNIQDPANLGAVIRTGEALGIDGAIICGGCDIYSPKAQRAAMGSLFRMPVFECESLPEFLVECKNNNMSVYASTPDNSARKITDINTESAMVCVIGNEGNGVSESVFEVCEKVTIPMLGRAESLNASMAAAIIMWEMMRGTQSNNG